MYGGLKKSASRLALVAAAGVLSTNAFAADLGGDCCADLEERVAELEATAARKGTRKTSLEIYGQVNREVLYWNDSKLSNTVLGVDNTNSSTRFGFRGDAKITPTVKAGYSILIDVTSNGATSLGVNQFGVATGVTGLVPGANVASPTSGYGANDHALEMRDANVWIESSQVGRLTLGRISEPGPVGTIDVAGINLVGGVLGQLGLQGGGLTFRNGLAPTGPGLPVARGTGNYTNYTIANTSDNAVDIFKRTNGIMYTTPTLAGFAITASAADAINTDPQCSNLASAGGGCNNFGYGPDYAAKLTYAGEMAGFRLAAAVGYETITSSNTISLSWNNASANNTVRPASINKGLSLSLLHVPTGLFAQGSVTQFVRGHDLPNVAAGGASSDTATQFNIQAGIAKNFFGIGNTSPFLSYTQTRNGFNTFGNQSGALLGVGAAGAAGVAAGQLSAGDVTLLKTYQIGINQTIDAAAMDIYAGYSVDKLTSFNCTLSGGCSDIKIFMTGARVKF